MASEKSWSWDIVSLSKKGQPNCLGISTPLLVRSQYFINRRHSENKYQYKLMRQSDPNKIQASNTPYCDFIRKWCLCKYDLRTDKRSL